MGEDKVLARVINDQVTMFTKPGGHRYVDWVKRGETVYILEGYRYEERTWKDKRFVKVLNKRGNIGFCIIDGLTPIKEKSK